MIKIIALILFFFKISKPTDFNYQKFKIILIPGFAGTPLLATFSSQNKCKPDSVASTRLWGSILLRKSDCIRQLKMKYDPAIHSMVDNAHVDISTFKYGTTKSVATLLELGNFLNNYEYFKDIIDFLKTLGYRENKDIYGIPYDFRDILTHKKLTLFIERLKQFIERIYFKEPIKRKIIFVTHSLGTTLLLKFINEQDPFWRAKHVDSQYSLSGSFNVDVKSVKMLLIGELDLEKIIDSIVNKKSIIEISKTFPSLYSMINIAHHVPDRRVIITVKEQTKVENLDDYSEEEKSKMSVDKFFNHYRTVKTSHYTASSIQQLYRDMEIENIEQILSMIVPLKTVIPRYHRIHVLHSIGIKTESKLTFFKRNGAYIKESYETEDGDGTITRNSLEYYKLCAFPYDTRFITHQIIEGIEHVDILSSKKTFTSLKQFIESRLEFYNQQISELYDKIK